MPNDFNDEESEIAKEQDRAPRALNADCFLRPIKELEPSPAITLTANTTLKEAVKVMQQKKIGAILVVNAKQEPIGIFTERDMLMKVLGHIPDWEKATLESAMTARPLLLRTTDQIAYVLNNMHVGGFRHIPIVDHKGKAVGMISIKDVVDWILDFFPQEINNLTGQPFRGALNQDGG